MRTNSPSCYNRWICQLYPWLILLGLAIGITEVLAGPKPVRQKKPVQGICGTVVEKRGNQMPGPGAPRTNAGGTPVAREVLIFPILNLSQVEAGDNGFIKSVGEAKPIQTIRSDKNGKFCVSLPIGRYSVIVREPKGLYANLSDTQNNIFPVNVQKNRQSTINVEITHQAVF
ncbi:hypothetical protein [Spirosoma endbachense]|uniref:Carboxypeptidase regulatory-like domain-containing protein n=1 Tax=Spirosoma endbachense TaxID=2666025 RepID=A0A6P1W2H4_9BACT|nr:hypothetical protein [Spirosoma endbachense]QHV98502.1 hypothetical protein GJR95_27415 [Spirosoma endbachense]